MLLAAVSLPAPPFRVPTHFSKGTLNNEGQHHLLPYGNHENSPLCIRRFIFHKLSAAAAATRPPRINSVAGCGFLNNDDFINEQNQNEWLTQNLLKTEEATNRAHVLTACITSCSCSWPLESLTGRGKMLPNYESKVDQILIIFVRKGCQEYYFFVVCWQRHDSSARTWKWRTVF